MVSHGGAAFPSNMKALTSPGKIDTLIANACECEPRITAYDILLRTSPKQVVQDLNIAKVLSQSATDRIVTVSGEGVRTSRDVLCPSDTSYEELIAHAGGLMGNGWKVVSGGPVMGMATGPLPQYHQGHQRGALPFPAAKPGKGKPSVHLLRPVETGLPHAPPAPVLYRYRSDAANLNRLRVLDCVKCGCRAYTCPGKLPLVDVIRQGKSTAKKALAA